MKDGEGDKQETVSESLWEGVAVQRAIRAVFLSGAIGLMLKTGGGDRAGPGVCWKKQVLEGTVSTKALGKKGGEMLMETFDSSLTCQDPWQLTIGVVQSVNKNTLLLSRSAN